jgi:cystathionine gamma-synthase
MNDDPSVIALHADRPVDDGPDIAPPLHLTTTYDQTGQSDLVYARKHHPTRDRLEAVLGGLEGGEAVCYPSGMAAIAAVLLHLRPRRVTLPGEDLYPGTRELLEAGAAAGDWELGPGGDLVFVETPSNPRCIVTDVAAAAADAHDRDARLVVDATFATPVLLRPLDLGADLVVHSTTKFIAGHSDALGGVAATADGATAAALRAARARDGAVPGVLETWLTLRGVRTLPLRVERQSATATEIAAMLSRHPAVARVWHPSLPGHPGSDAAARQMRAPGGMLSFELASEADALAVAGRLRLFRRATSLGAVESLVEHRRRADPRVPATLLRVSVGLESPGALIDDLERALAGLPSPPG